jgi:hypothetical protein
MKSSTTLPLPPPLPCAALLLPHCLPLQPSPLVSMASTSKHPSSSPPLILTAAGCGPGELLELREDWQHVMLVKDWNFKFEAGILSKFSSSVHHPSSSLRVVTTCLGSLNLSLVGFHVTFLKDRHFHFSVASKQVGFVVCDLKRIITLCRCIQFCPHTCRIGSARSRTRHGK